MSFVEKRKSLFGRYLPFVVLIILAALFSSFATPFSISLIFLSVVFAPGFALSRILRITFQKDNLGQFVLWFTIGFIYNLLLCLLAITFHFYLSQLIWLNLILSSLLFIAAFVLDIKNPIENMSDLKQYLKLENLVFVFLAGLIILVLSVVDQLGTNFTGDPLYHLAILRRAVEGQALSIEGLSHVKNQFHSAYIFPVWHVFLGLLTKLSGTNIFVLYREIPTILTLLVFMVWYWFFLKILPNRNLAILALFLFILFHFYNNGYLYTRMPVPDTFNMLLLMPLNFGLALNYIFNKESTYKHLIILSLMLALMGLIHWTQYFYWLFAMGLFAVLYAIFKYRGNDFWLIFKKVLLSIFANMILVLPVLLFIQVKARVVSENMQTFTTVTKVSTNDRLYKFDPYFKLSYILLPLIAVFFRKYRRLIFILAVFLAGPLVFNVPGLYPIVRRLLSHVFVNRFYTNLGQWPYIIWAILIGFILVLVDRLLSKTYSSRRYLRFLIDGFLLMFLVWMFWMQYYTGRVQEWYFSVFDFSTSTFNFLNANLYWLIPVIAGIALIVYILQKYYSSLVEFFTFEEYENHSTMLILTLIIVFFLGVPSFSHLSHYSKKEFQNLHFFREATDPTTGFINPDKFGGMAAIDFIKKNIPPKSVFDTNTQASYTLPTLADVHMASYSIDPIAPTKKYKDLYNVSVPIEKKLTMLKESEIDYLVYQYKPDESQSSLDPYPEYFIKIYQSPTAAIYQVNKEQVQLDLKS